MIVEQENRSGGSGGDGGRGRGRGRGGGIRGRGGAQGRLRGRGEGVYEMNYETSIQNLSLEGWRTLLSVNRRRRQRFRPPGTRAAVFDNRCRRYGWLLPGWIVEERLMASGRLYRYYYDPIGQMYNTRDQVMNVYADLGVVILDL